MEYRVKEVGEKTEISVVFSTPTIDIPYIRYANDKFINDNAGNAETRDKFQFERLKSIFKNTHFTQNDFFEKSEKLYSNLFRLKNDGILKDDIDISFDKDGHILGYPYLSDIFMSCSISYMEGKNKQCDGLFFYPIITDWHIESTLELVKDEYKDDLIRTLPFSKLLIGEIRCNILMDSISELKLHDNKVRYTYVMSDISGYYKIGRSFYPEYRKSQLSCGNPTIKLEFFINGDREHELQKHFENKRVNGEWFALDKKDLKYIKNYNNIRI